MIVEDNRKRQDLIPRKEIPAAWAEKGRCPVCAASPLKLVHLGSLPDYLLCPQCELSFEVEMNSTLIRLKNIPDQLGFVEADLRHRWIESSILRKLLDNRQALLRKNVQGGIVNTLSDAEVWKRMVSLYRLGNKPKMVEFMVIQSGATQEQATAGALRLKQVAAQDAKIQNQKIFLVAAVTLLIVFVMVMGSWTFASSQIQAQLDGGLANRSAPPKSLLPMDVIKAIPDALKPEFLKSAPPQVAYNGPAPSRCPTSSTEAVALFGGASGTWQRGSTASSWQMITTGTPLTIRIPKGMYAGFIDNTTFVFHDAQGPATISNVNFIVIACE